MNKYTIAISAVLLSTLSLSAQVYPFASDAQSRGYITRPYLRYEAEPDYCTTNALLLAATDDQGLLQSEASHQQAVCLRQQGDYVSWTLAQEADGLTIRFSLPDSPEGLGTRDTLQLLLNGELLTLLPLDSYWAWQYTARGGNYPDNTPGEGKMVRMRFDETHLRLPQPLQAGDTLTLLLPDSGEVTVDFVELERVPEPVSYAQVQAEYPAAIAYDPQTDGDLAAYVDSHKGQTIYLPAARISTDRRIYINRDSTRLIGAGMWWTEVFFSASSDSMATYSHRGIESGSSAVLISGLYLNTANRCRYYLNDDRYQVGKGFNGSFGRNSRIDHCWVEHFECGAWIGNYSGNSSGGLLITDCRFRNNYADGLNCAHGIKDATIQHCSFRNNGDDDMASWSDAVLTQRIEFAYCTAENNWRASSLGLFGGRGHRAHHIYIADPLECGLRVNADFSGKGFSTADTIQIYDITIEHAGCIGGSFGRAGDFWGNMQGAVNIGGTAYYDVSNIRLAHVDVLDSRSHSFFVRSGSGHQLRNISLEDIYVRGTGYVFYFSAPSGTMNYCHISYDDARQGWMNLRSLPSSFIFTDCEEPQGIDNPYSSLTPTAMLVRIGTHLFVQRGSDLYSMSGQRVLH